MKDNISDEYDVLAQLYSERDWTEDFEHENGKYANNCIFCRENFFGYKQRVFCKSCSILKYCPGGLYELTTINGKKHILTYLGRNTTGETTYWSARPDFGTQTILGKEIISAKLIDKSNGTSPLHRMNINVRTKANKR